MRIITMRLRSKNARGYLLLDIAIGGALFAIAVMTIMSVLADARNRNTWAARDVVATQLVQQELERQSALGFSGATASGATVVAGETGKYTRTVAVSGATAETAGTVSMRFKTITVTVSYTVHNTAQPTRTSQATTRVYQ